MLLTISMIVMGDQPLILPCLESISSQTTVAHEIFLVNNLAKPSLVKEVARRFPQVQIIHNSHNLSFAANNNQVMRCSRGEIVLLLNDDTVILDHTLDRMVDFLSHQPTETGIAGCTNLDGNGNFTLSCYPFPDAKGIIWQHARAGRWLPGHVHHRYLDQARGKEPFPVDWVLGSCIAIRRQVIEQVGYLDEDFFLYSEEVDYCYRAKMAGFEVYQIPQAHIIHYQSVSTSRVVQIKLRGHYLSKLYFLAKHGFKRDLRVVRAWFIAELLVKSAVRWVGMLTGHPPDAQLRLRAYLDLVRICLSYQGQPASDLLRGK
jgi:GT2 family glycosyltransferase